MYIQLNSRLIYLDSAGSANVVYEYEGNGSFETVAQEKFS